MFILFTTVNSLYASSCTSEEKITSPIHENTILEVKSISQSINCDGESVLTEIQIFKGNTDQKVIAESCRGTHEKGYITFINMEDVICVFPQYYDYSSGMAKPLFQYQFSINETTKMSELILEEKYCSHTNKASKIEISAEEDGANAAIIVDAKHVLAYIDCVQEIKEYSPRKDKCMFFKQNAKYTLHIFN